MWFAFKNIASEKQTAKQEKTTNTGIQVRYTNKDNQILIKGAYNGGKTVEYLDENR